MFSLQNQQCSCLCLLTKSLLSTMRSRTRTVIDQFKKNKRLSLTSPSRLHAARGLGSTFHHVRSSILFLLLTINCLSTSDLLSSNGGSSGGGSIVPLFAVSARSNGGNGLRPNGLRCYVCGGNTGLPCEDIHSGGRRSPYIRPKPQTTLDGRKMFENCTDLINNKACIKQVVNGGKGVIIKMISNDLYHCCLLRCLLVLRYPAG